MVDKPNYVKLLEEGRFPEKLKKAYNVLRKCSLCPRNCHVNRIEGEKGFCETTAKVKISSCFPHFGEERPLVGKNGSGTIFISHCNLKCVFCQNNDISHHGYGEITKVKELAKLMLKIQAKGCHNINVVSPTHVAPQVMAALYHGAKKGLNIPFVYNTGGYDSPELIRLLDGVVDIYLPDFKFGDDEIAEKFTGAKDYFTVAKKNLALMYDQVGPMAVKSDGIAFQGVIVRHLVMPGEVANSKKVFEYIKSISSKIPINIMGQYFPSYQAGEYKEINRRPEIAEILQAKKWAQDMGLKVLD